MQSIVKHYYGKGSKDLRLERVVRRAAGANEEPTPPWKIAIRLLVGIALSAIRTCLQWLNPNVSELNL